MNASNPPSSCSWDCRLQGAPHHMPTRNLVKHEVHINTKCFWPYMACASTCCPEHAEACCALRCTVSTLGQRPFHSKTAGTRRNWYTAGSPTRTICLPHTPRKSGKLVWQSTVSASLVTLLLHSCIVHSLLPGAAGTRLRCKSLSVGSRISQARPSLLRVQMMYQQGSHWYHCKQARHSSCLACNQGY